MNFALALKILLALFRPSEKQTPASSIKVVTPKTHLVVDRRNVLRLDSLGQQPGHASLEVNTHGVCLQVASWTDTRLEIFVPMIGISEPHDATLFLFDKNMKLIRRIDVELLTPAMMNLSETSKSESITQSDCFRWHEMAS